MNVGVPSDVGEVLAAITHGSATVPARVSSRSPASSRARRVRNEPEAIAMGTPCRAFALEEEEQSRGLAARFRNRVKAGASMWRAVEAATAAERSSLARTMAHRGA